MDRCVLTGNRGVNWHHNFIYGGCQVNEAWCILPVSPQIHAIADRKDIKERLDWIMLNRATEHDLQRYIKAKLIEKRDRLNKRFGLWHRPDNDIL
jgi:hypothetical protein